MIGRNLGDNATTLVLPGVFEGMRPYFCEEWRNPSSACKSGSKLKGVIEMARAQVAELIGAQLREIMAGSEALTLSTTAKKAKIGKSACKNTNVGGMRGS